MSTTVIPAVKRSARPVTTQMIYACVPTMITRRSKINAVHGKQLEINPHMSPFPKLTKKAVQIW